VKITAIANRAGGNLPPSVGHGEIPAFRDLLRCVSPQFGPVLRASSFLGFGSSGGGGYAGHAELFDLDGLLRDFYNQPSMSPGVNDTLFGGGKGFQLHGATLSTVGEAVERAVAAITACSALIPSERIVGTYSDMVAAGRPALSPERVHLFSDEQYEQPGFLYRRFGEDVAVQWVRGRTLVSREEIWVPAQLVDMVHIYDRAEEIVGYPVSGGLSCHTTPLAATYHGLTEVIERDAVNVSWYTDAAPFRVVMDGYDGSMASFIERLIGDHSEHHVLMHPSGVCSSPTFSIVGLQRWYWRRQYCAGGGCDVVPAEALRKAAAEFGQTRSTLSIANMAPGSSVGRSVRTMFDWRPGRPLAEMELFFQAIGYYGLDDYLPSLESYLSGPEVEVSALLSPLDSLPTSASLGERMERLLGELTQKGIDPIILDYSHPDWSSLSVVKVFVPELSTPFLQSRPMLGHPRLAQLRADVVLPNARVAPLPYP